MTAPASAKDARADKAGKPHPTITADDGTSYGPLGRLGLWTTDHFRVVLGVWVLVAVGLGFFAPRVEHALAGAGWEASGSESVAARDLVDKEFAGLSSAALQVVVHSDTQSVDSPAVQRVIASATLLLRADDRITPRRAAHTRSLDQRRRLTPPSSRPEPPATPTRWSAPPTT